MTQRANNDPMSEVWRLSAFDQAAGTSQVGLPFGLQVRAGNFRQMWLGFRQRFTSNSFTMNGLVLNLAPFSSTNSGTVLIDTTPETSSRTDSPVVLGRRSNDENLGISVTPIAKGGTSPEIIDVQVDFATVAPIVTSLVISPSSTSVPSGGTRQFSVSATDQFGNSLSNSDVSWFVTCGTISSSGLYTAPATPGTCQAYARSAGGLESNRASISVIDPVLTSIVVSPGSATTGVGKTVTFSASARDQYGNVMSPQPAFAWSVSPVLGTINSAGVFTAMVTGKGKVNAATSGITGSANITVKSAGGGGKPPR